MSSTDSDIRSGAKRAGASTRDADELANQIDAIRADLQNLTGTVTRIAKGQVNRAQDKAMETAYEAEEAIRRNPLSAVAIAVGQGGIEVERHHEPRNSGRRFSEKARSPSAASWEVRQ